MKAIVYTRYGAPDVLQVKELEKPIPEDDEILIRVRAAEATKADCEMRSFNFPVKWFWLPLRIAFGIRKPRRQILGGYFAGEVVSTGKAVTRFKKGDPVFGSTRLRMGAYGEYVNLPEKYTIAPKPQSMTFEEAAAVPLGGLNALHFLQRARIQKGEKVLVNGAGGSIGTFAIQIAKAMGAEVTAVDSGIKEAMLRRTGADHFIDYTKENFVQNGKKYDAILDMVARKSYSKSIKSLNHNGRYLIANPRLSDMLRSVLTTRFTDKEVVVALAGEKEEELLALREMIDKGQIKSVIDKVYPMEQATEAHRRVETEQRLGLVVIRME